MAKMNRPAIVIILGLLAAYGILGPNETLKMYLLQTSSSFFDNDIDSIAATTMTTTTMTTEEAAASASAAVTTTMMTTDDRDDDDEKKEKTCVSMDADLPRLLNSTTNVITLSAAKVAGTAFMVFAEQCTGVGRKDVNSRNWKKFLFGGGGGGDGSSSFEVPSVVADHALNPMRVQEIARHASRRTLIIWMHREETDRLLSAIRQVVKVVCSDGGKRSYGFTLLEQTEERCTISEKDLIEKVIEEKIYEIGKGSERLLTCDTYRTVSESLPRMIFADYRRSDDIMVNIARRHCPHVLGKLPLRTNVATDFERELYVKLSQKYKETRETNHVVLLDDWLTAKGGHLEMTLKLKQNMTCQGTTRRMEDAIDRCEDHVIGIDDDWIGYHQ